MCMIRLLRGSIPRLARKSQRRCRVHGESPLQRAGEVLARSPVCLAKTFAFFKVFCLRRGRRVLLGAAAPRSTPFQPPPATPLALVFARTSLWPGRFSGKIDACHKPLGKRHHDLPSSFARTWGRLASPLFPGEELRSTGALGKVFSRKRPGSCAAGCLLGGRERSPGPLCA